MADIYIDVDTAVVLPVNRLPLVAKSDGTTISGAVAYNAAGMDLNWNFVTSAGVATHTNVVPTTAGVHDWTAVSSNTNGMYQIEIPASAGTINNDTEGYGWFTGETTAEAAWTSPVYCFRAAALNDALVDGGDNLDVNVTQVAGTAQTAKDLGQAATDLETGLILSQCGATSLTTTTCSSDLVGYADNQLIGRLITFTSGNCEGEQSNITDYASTNGVITFSALTTAPADNDTFKIT